MNKAPAIPDDLAACQAMIREHARTIASRDQTIASQLQAIHKLESAYNELLQRAFRNRSERCVADLNQLKIASWRRRRPRAPAHR